MSDPAAVMARLNEIVRAYTAKDAPCAQLDCLQCKVVATCADAAAVIAQLSETYA